MESLVSSYQERRARMRTLLEKEVKLVLVEIYKIDQANYPLKVFLFSLNICVKRRICTVAVPIPAVW